MPHMLIKYAHVLICISAGEGSRHFSAFHYIMIMVTAQKKTVSAISAQECMSPVPAHMLCCTDTHMYKQHKMCHYVTHKIIVLVVIARDILLVVVVVVLLVPAEVTSTGSGVVATRAEWSALVATTPDPAAKVTSAGTNKTTITTTTYTLFTLQIKPNRARPEPNRTVLALQYKPCWPSLAWHSLAWLGGCLHRQNQAKTVQTGLL